MGKVTRKKLGRGIELTVDQVFDPLVGMKAQVEGNIEAEQLQARYATFRLNYNIPWLGSKYFYDNRTIGTELEYTSSTGAFVPAGPVWYHGAPTTTSGAGTGLTVDIQVTGGVITVIYVNDSGSGYQDGETITVADPGSSPNSVTYRLTTRPDVHDGPFYIPFCLPPLQENIEGGTSVLLKSGAAFPILDEVSFSLDQSDEPAMVLDQWYGRDKYQYAPPRRWMPNPYAGKKTYNRTDAYDFTLSIYEKEQFFFNDSAMETEPFAVQGEAVSLNIPSSAFISRSTRFNPIAVGDINRQFDPFKTYVLAIFAPKLHDVSTGRNHCMANNVWVSLKFKMLLTDRDTASAGSPELVQNIPENYGQRTAPSVTITEPALPENLVIADGQDTGANEVGISTNLQNIDQQFSDKLRGGYNEFSQTYPTQPIKDDAAYEVITVPLGAGFVHNRMSVRDDYPLAPYVSGHAFTSPAAPAYEENPYVDRRIIPIDSEMTIHHVIVALNWTSDKLQVAYDPAAAGAGEIAYQPATLPLNGANAAKYSVGVGMLTGTRADEFEYQQVAYSEFQPSTTSFASAANGLIDCVKLDLPACRDMPTEWALISVPVRNQAGLSYAPVPAANGTGYWGFETTPTWLKGQQGRPYFVGEGNTYTAARTPVGTAAGGAADATPLGQGQGCEQFLEVRLSVEPQALVYDGVTVPGTIEYQSFNQGDIFLGYGGCWVYIIGKKHLK